MGFYPCSHVSGRLVSGQACFQFCSFLGSVCCSVSAGVPCLMVGVRFWIISFVPSTVVLRIPSKLILGVGNVGNSVSMLLDVVSISVSIWSSWPGCGSGLNCWLSSWLADESVETIGERVGVDVSGLGFPVSVLSDEFNKQTTSVPETQRFRYRGCLFVEFTFRSMSC